MSSTRSHREYSSGLRGFGFAELSEALVTKYAGAWLGARSLGREAALVGAGMVPRGEVGIIVAGIGKASESSATSSSPSSSRCLC